MVKKVKDMTIYFKKLYFFLSKCLPEISDLFKQRKLGSIWVSEKPGKGVKEKSLAIVEE
jgi:hypothetical protein